MNQISEMHWSKILLHMFSLLAIFMVGVIMVHPITDWIKDGTMRVAVRELGIRIPLTLLLFWLYSRFFSRDRSQFIPYNWLSYRNLLWIMIGIALPFLLLIFHLVTGNLITMRDVEYPIMLLFRNLVIAFSTAASAALIEEILFRGYLLNLLLEKWNIKIAIFVSSILFASLHLLGRPEMNVLEILLILVSGTVVGVMFAWIVYRTKSIWNAIFVHLFWNFILSERIFHLDPYAEAPSTTEYIFKMQFNNYNTLLTGGKLGIEASVPAIILYLLVILLIEMKHKSQKN